MTTELRDDLEVLDHVSNDPPYDARKVNLAVVAVKAMGLGIMFLTSITLALLHHQVSVCLFIAAVVVFHLAEFFCTSVYNTSATDDDSFILNDTDLLLAYLVSIIEYCVRHWLQLVFLPQTAANVIPILAFVASLVGGVVVILGQTFRSLAMCTAKESFNHYIQRQHEDKHVLVTHGIYGVLRHPLYFGFFWWFVGLQIWLGNPITLVAGGYKLWLFFRHRIEFEEAFLVLFFGKEYVQYKKRTPVLIPLIG